VRIERLAIHNLLAFRDPVELDVRDVPPGLVAIVGPNGSGKSSLLDAMVAAFYRKLPSRAGLLESACGPGYIECQIELEGRGVYRGRVEFDPVKRTQSAVLSFLEPDGFGWTLCNDGKVSTFDAAVAQLLPPYDVLLASAFASQNRAGSFVRLDRKGRKDLFSHLLGLEKYDAYAATARERALDADRLVRALQITIGVLEKQTSPAIYEGLNAQEGALTRTVASAEADLHILTKEQAVLVERRDRLTIDATRYQEAMAGEAQRQAQRVTLVKAVRAAESRLTEARQRFDQLAKQGDQCRTELETVSQTVNRADRIRWQATAMTAIEQEVSALIAAGLEAERALTDLLAQLADAQSDVRYRIEVTNDLRRAEQSAQLLTRTPFGEKCVTAGCEFVAQAVTARNQIAVFREALLALEAAPAVAATLASTVEAQQVDQTARRTRIRELQTQLKAAHADTRRQEQQLAVAADAKARLLAQLASCDTTAASARCVQETNAAYDTAFALEQWDHDEADRAARMTPLREAAAAVGGVKRQLDELDRARQAAADRRMKALTEQEALQAQRLTLKAVEDQIRVQRQDVDQQAQELTDWQALATIFGREGLPVYEIDAAGPAVSALANDLLQACFGGRFSVELVTQMAKASGGGQKETFELLVWDTERGNEARELSDLSGGEQILVDEALKSAIALFVNSHQPIESNWRDETTGALDGENALHYVDMLRRVLDRGHLHHCYFVSHNPAAASLADAQVQIAEGGSVSLVYPPF